MSDEFSYIAFDENGSAVAICCDDPQYKRDTAKHIADWIRRGRTVERMEHAAACQRLKSDWDNRRDERAQSK